MHTCTHIHAHTQTYTQVEVYTRAHTHTDIHAQAKIPKEFGSDVVPLAKKIKFEARYD